MNELGSTNTYCPPPLGNSSWTETPGIRLAPGVWTDWATVLKGPVNSRELGFLLAFQERAPGFVLPFRISCSPQPILPDVTNTGSIAFPLLTGQDPTYNYISSTFMPHGDLFQYVQIHPLDLPTQITFVLDLLSIASDLLACGVVHGDISPENFLVDKDLRLRIIDFGFAMSADGYKQPRICGKLHYLDPALIQLAHSHPEKLPADFSPHTIDHFALGLTILFMLTRNHCYHTGEYSCTYLLSHGSEDFLNWIQKSPGVDLIHPCFLPVLTALLEPNYQNRTSACTVLVNFKTQLKETNPIEVAEFLS
jgi:serine/threonine protein kinase